MKQKFFIFPFWVWMFGILAWFSAEIVTVSTIFTQINVGTPIFSFSYYMIQIAITADLILRRRLSFLGIVIVGLIFGLLEEALYIKNPLPLTLLLALGHSAVTVTFPYLLINFLIPEEKRSFLNKKSYAIMLGYLAILYILMSFSLPFVYIDSLIAALILLVILGVCLKKFDQSGPVLGTGLGIKKSEGLIVTVLALAVTIISQQNYLGVIFVFLWLIARRKVLNTPNVYFAVSLFLVCNFLLSFINKATTVSKIAVNYPVVLVVALILLILLWKNRNTLRSF